MNLPAAHQVSVDQPRRGELRKQLAYKMIDKGIIKVIAREFIGESAEFGAKRHISDYY